MKRWILLSWMFLAAVPCAADAEPRVSADEQGRQERSADAASLRAFYVVETDASSASESLNRITGEYDRGFSTSDQSYDSPHHESADRFSTQGPSFEY